MVVELFVYTLSLVKLVVYGRHLGHLITPSFPAKLQGLDPWSLPPTPTKKLNKPHVKRRTQL